VVSGDARLQPRDPAAVVEGGQIGVTQVGGPLLGDAADGGPQIGIDQADPALKYREGGTVTPGSAEDEVDHGQHALIGEMFDDLHPPRCGEPGPPPPFEAEQVFELRIRAELAALVREGGQHHHALGAHAVGHQVSPFQRHRAFGGDDECGVAPSLGYPGGELVGVGDGGRQRHHANVGWSMDQHLLPHRPPEPVLEVVHFVEDHELDLVEGAGVGVDHVAEDLGGHHHDLGSTVDDVVAGQQTHTLGPVGIDQIVELLIRERLDRCGVEHPAT
jgi:hypothetical protein